MTNPFEDLLGTLNQKPKEYDLREYRCNKCNGILVRLLLESNGKPKKMFYCPINTCERFGLVTVAAK